jgi:hypothetical protein
MKTLKTMTKDERSLLLFLETRAVDHAGRVDTRHMNSDDFEIAKRWDAEGFVNFGRIAFEHCNDRGSHWCKLSPEAHQLCGEERAARAERTWKKRTWRTTEEKRNAA